MKPQTSTVAVKALWARCQIQDEHAARRESQWALEGQAEGAPSEQFRPGASTGGPETDEKGGEETQQGLESAGKGIYRTATWDPQTGNRR